MKIRLSPRKFWYFFFAIFVLTFRFWGKDMNIYLKYIVSLPWLLYAFAAFLYNPHSRRTNVALYHYLLMAAPVFVMALYAYILWMFNPNVIFRNYTRLCSTLIYLMIAWGYGVAGYYFFREDAVDCLFAAGTTSYFLGSVCCLVIQYGWAGIVAFSKNLFRGEYNDITNVMEVHDLTFAMGIFFLYYLFFEDKSRRFHRSKILVSAILVVFGLKRIEILALAGACLVYLVFLRKPCSLRSRATLFAVGGVTISFLYIFLIKSGLLSLICSVLNIETSGRLMAYDYATGFFDFAPHYLGSGFTYFSRMWEQLYNSGFRLNVDGWMLGVAASVHSDILAMYIENGFFLFAMWMWFFFSTKTKKILHVSGEGAARCYLLIAVYMFILYLTDNTFGYHDTQMLFCLVPLAMTQEEKAPGTIR